MAEWLEDAVFAVCSSPECRAARNVRRLQDDELWFELSTCILGSQVPNALAVAAAIRLRDVGVFRSDAPHRSEEFIRTTITVPLITDQGLRRYRFPSSRARQLASAFEIVERTSGSLTALVYETPLQLLRPLLVERIPGIGLKQASMFLRNIGISQDFAILDVHVVNYMLRIGLIRREFKTLSSEMYFVLESILSNYARRIGFPVGHVDRAIWAVMSSIQNLK